MTIPLKQSNATERQARDTWDDEGGAGVTGPRTPSHVAGYEAKPATAVSDVPEGAGPFSPGPAEPTVEHDPEAGGYEQHPKDPTSGHARVRGRPV